MQLLGDKRLIAISRSAKGGLHRAELPLEGACRLVAVAQQATSGAFIDVRAFQCAVKTAVHTNTSQPTLSGLVDQLDCWCYSIAKCLGS